MSLNFNEWKNKINNINTKFIKKDELIEFFKKFTLDNKFDFIKVENEKLKMAFLNIGIKELIIAYDIEFKKVHESFSKEYIASRSEFLYEIGFIREFGMLMFLKDVKTNDIYYIGDIFLNFPHFDKLNIDKDLTRIVISDYSSVNDKVRTKMEKNQNKFLNEEFIKSYLKQHNRLDRLDFFINNKKKILFDIIRQYLSDEYKKIFDKQWELYLNDELVKNRTINLEDMDYFLKTFHSFNRNVVYIVKGKNDMEAIVNMCKISQNNKLENGFIYSSYYDIEIFNGFSRNIYGDAKLETTYNNIINSKLYKQNASSFFDQVKKRIPEIAHNPVADSLFSTIVAISINLCSNSCFYDNRENKELEVPDVKNDKKISENSFYHKKYRKWKKKYLEYIKKR